MGSSRLIVLVFLASVGAFCSLHRASRAWMQGALVETRLRILGASASDLSSADELYRLAERQYVAGDFERVELSCERALRLVPHHVPAAAYLLEVRFLLGQLRATGTVDGYWSRTPIPHSHTPLELLASAERFMRTGETVKAEREFRRVLEYAKGMPTSIELDQICRRAQAGLGELSAPPGGPAHENKRPRPCGRGREVADVSYVMIPRTGLPFTSL